MPTDDQINKEILRQKARDEISATNGGRALSTLQGQGAGLGSMAMNRAERTPAVNPYQTGIADQTRAAQLALMQQMEAQRTGPSLAAMQGQGAMGASTQQALAAGAMGQGRNAMLGSRMASSGLASDVARARMMEDLKARAGIGGVAGALRGQDLKSAEQQQQAGLAAQGMSDEMARFYGGMGNALDSTRLAAELEQFKLQQQLITAEKKRQEEATQTALRFVGGLFGGLI